MIPWGPLNRVLYRTATWWAAHAATRLPRVAPRAGTGDAILYVAWGRIGDAILGSAAIELLRARTGRAVIVAGRAETAPVIARLADGFIPLPDPRDPAASARFATATAGPWFAAVSDLHLFHGGARMFGDWLASLPAQYRLVYDGYAPRRRLAPWRALPAAVQVVPALAKRDTVGTRHVLFDLAHHLSHVLARLGARAHSIDVADLAPTLPPPPDANPAAHVACQPFSNNRKKDWPAARWRALFAAFPTQHFVLLGAAKDRARAAQLAAGNVDNRCGDTDLPAALQVIARSHAFVGIDSGLAHAAAALRRPTVVVGHGSNLGYFFPYPEALRFAHVEAVHDARFEPCSGCLSACTREPIWRTYRSGALCLRELDTTAVRGALARVLAATAAVAQLAHSR